MRVTVEVEISTDWSASGATVHAAMLEAAEGFKLTAAGGTISPGDGGDLFTFRGPRGRWHASE